MKRGAVLGCCLCAFSLLLADGVSINLPVLTVCGDKGHLNRVPFRYERTDSKEALRISISDDIPSGSRETIRSSVWSAVMTAAMIKKDPLEGVRVSIDFSGDVDGPSAGGVMCLATLLAMEGNAIPGDFAMTGTILPDGSIGLVGGIANKIRGAAGKGARRICIPAFGRYEKQSNGDELDLFRIGDELNVSIFPVRNVDEAYRVLTGKPLMPDCRVDEVETLRLGKDLDRFLTGYCEKILRFDCGTNGPQHVIGISKVEDAFLNEAYEKTGVEHFRDKRALFWDSVSKLRRNKVLTAYRQAEFYASLPSWGVEDDGVVSSFYRYVSTNENAIVDKISCQGRQVYAQKSVNWFYHKNGQDGAFLSGEETSQRLNAVREYADFVRRAAISLASRIEDASLSVEAEIKVRVSDELCRGNPICLQGVDVLELLSRMIARCEVLKSAWREMKIEAGNGYEVAEEIKAIINQAYELDSIAVKLKCLGEEADVSTTNQCMYGAAQKRLMPAKNVDSCERSFYQALRSVQGAFAAEIDDDARRNNVAVAVAQRRREINDREYKPFERWCMVIDHLHRQIADIHGPSTNMLNAACFHVLYQCSQALGKAYALQIKYSPDAQREGFVEHLIRMARESALRSISECRKKGVICLDPMLKFEMADEAHNQQKDAIHDVLEYYWRAHLGAKALSMSFELANGSF